MQPSRDPPLPPPRTASVDPGIRAHPRPCLGRHPRQLISPRIPWAASSPARTPRQTACSWKLFSSNAQVCPSSSIRRQSEPVHAVQLMALPGSHLSRPLARSTSSYSRRRVRAARSFPVTTTAHARVLPGSPPSAPSHPSPVPSSRYTPVRRLISPMPSRPAAAASGIVNAI